MPTGYEHMRDEFHQQMLSSLPKGAGKKARQNALKRAKTKAAKIWNSQNPTQPVGPSENSSKTPYKSKNK